MQRCARPSRSPSELTLTKDSAPLRKLHRVRGEVGENLTDTTRVSDQVTRNAGYVLDHDLGAVFQSVRGRLIGHVLDQRCQVERDELESYLSGFDLREIQDIVDYR